MASLAVSCTILLVAIGRAEEAIREAHRALELDPLSVNAATMLGQVLYYARRFDASETALRRALEIDPNYPTAVVFLGLVHLARQEFAEGVAAVARAASVHPHHLFLGTLGMAYGLAGRHHEAAGILDQLTDLADRSYVSPYSFAWVYEGLGDRERWRELITAAFDERSGLLVHLDAPWNDGVRDDPFFAEIRRKVGLPKLPTTSH